MNQDLPQILLAEEAFDWLDSSGRQAAWEALYQRCPWRFPTLGPHYFRLWFLHYAAEWQPLLAIVATPEGELRLVMPLAVREGLITGVGAQQAEYQGWLCSEKESPDLLLATLVALDTRLPRHLLRLHYLAPGISEPTMHHLCNRNSRAMSTIHSRPLMRLDDGFAEKALRKKNTRSKINRLKRRGELTFRRLTDIAEIESRLDAIIAMYDFRQGAANDSCPFVDDPHKKAFLLDWARQSASEQLHISCLMLDDEIIGTHIGVISGDTSQLSILAYSPRYSDLSPGKIQVYETARQLAQEGLSILDLTPGGDPWKERFANEHDTVLSLTVYPDWRAALTVRLKNRLDSLARGLLELVGTSPRDIKRILRSLRPSVQLRGTGKPDNGAANLSTYQLNRFGSSDSPPSPRRRPGSSPRAEDRIHRNALSDLTLYCENSDELTRQSFLQQALSRIESGESAYTLVRGDRLAACAWVRQEQTDMAVIHDIYCAVDEMNCRGRLISGVLAHLKEAGTGAVQLHMVPNEGHKDDWMEGLGFTSVDTSVVEATDTDQTKKEA